MVILMHASSLSSSPSASFPMMMQLPNGQTVPLLPSPGQTSVISVRCVLSLTHTHIHSLLLLHTLSLTTSFSHIKVFWPA